MNILKRRFLYIKKLLLSNISMFFKRDPNLYVFGSWFGEKYADNSKSLYRYFLKKGENAFWITKNESLYAAMKKEGLPVALANSSEGKNLCKKAGFVFTSTGLADVNENYIGGATIVELFHGIPLKKIMYDDAIGGTMLTVKRKIHDKLMSKAMKDYFVFSSSETVTKSIKTAFRVDDVHILNYGLPRNDAFFDGSLKKMVFQGREYKRVISYLPTHRNIGKTKIPLDIIFDLEALDNFCQQNSILFVIKKHFYHKHEITELKTFNNIIDITGKDCDTQELLYNSDVLITDYSSCFIDYLLLNRPIIFYAYDLQEYLINDREMYYKYEEIVPGTICTDFGSLLQSLNKTINENFVIKPKQEKVRNLFFSKRNQKMVCDYYYQFAKSHRK